MRLLNVHTLQFQDFFSEPPPYVVASHRWSAGQEMTIQDVRKGRWSDSPGCQKVLGFINYIKSTIATVQWLWMDTCCVNQKSDREVSETVNSMFRWYSNAYLCLAYLADVDMGAGRSERSEWPRSVWFRRGWTLQELLAPPFVLFLDCHWGLIGHKGNSSHIPRLIRVGVSLEGTIHERTGIPISVLRNYDSSKTLSVQQRIQWMEGRQTTCPEDMSYSLLGIFDVTMPVIYGEGAEKARRRLLEEIYRPPIKLPYEHPSTNPSRQNLRNPQSPSASISARYPTTASASETPPPLPPSRLVSRYTPDYPPEYRSTQQPVHSDYTAYGLRVPSTTSSSHATGRQPTQMDLGKQMLFEQYELGYQMMANQAADMRRQGRHNEAEKLDAMVVSMRNRTNR